MEGEDLPSVTTLYRTVFGEAAFANWQRRFDWQFNQNPATALKAARMWVGTADGTILGFLAAFPARLKVLDRLITILHPCDLMVSPEARGERLGERLIRGYIEEAGGLANALAYSPSAGRLYDRIGYQSVLAEPGYLRPVKGSRLLRAMAAKRFSGLSTGAGLVACTSLLAPLAAAIVASVNKVRTPRAPSGFYIDVNPPFDSDFDDLWLAASREMPVAFVRDAEFLRWRFLADPVTDHTVFGARNSAGVLLGYAVVCETSRNALRIGKIMDVFCAPSNAKSVVSAVLPSVLGHFRQLDVDVVATKGLHVTIRKELRRYLYVMEPGVEMPARLLWTGDPSLADVVYSADNWHLAHSDGDDDFTP